MKVTVERDAFKEALSAIGSTSKGSSGIPILSAILIECADNAIHLTAHNLDSCEQLTLAAEVGGAGKVVLSAERLSRLVFGLAKGSHIALSVLDGKAQVKCGRSLYQIEMFPPEDFPEPLQPNDASVPIKLTPKQVGELFKTPIGCVSNEQSRIYLTGIFLHAVDGKLAACATNGHILLRTITDVPAPEFTPVIVPEKSCEAFVGMAIDDVTLRVSANLIAMECADRRFVSKLIDASFPDYLRVIPQRVAEPMTVDTAELDHALARLLALRDPKARAVARLSWDGAVESIKADLRTEYGRGEEMIECDSAGRDAGEVGAQIEYLQRLIKSLGGVHVRLLIGGPGDPIRLENPADDGVVAVCMPCRW